ncbi:MAG: hypothetical protein SFV23_03110 [Planctomycetaceae bacterium]|nr:hypothetical protein [Planctomycetaceae bacterium]
MQRTKADQRTWWLLAGVVVGVGLSSLWPVETLQAVATDREERFAIITCDTGLAQPESVFVLDFLTGRLFGATLNQQTGTFTSTYFRIIAGDFQLDATSKPKYVVIPGRADLTSGRGATTGASVLYIGELNSGKVIAYRFPVRVSRTPLPTAAIEPLDQFTFREAVAQQ